MYRIIAANWATFLQERAYEGRDVPKFIGQEFEGFLRCGILACGVGRVCFPSCGVDKRVAFSCKGRGFCSSCGARRMAEAAASLVDELVPVRQFVVTFPPPLRLWLARSTTLATSVCEKVIAALTAHLRRESGVKEGLAGFVVLMQRFGSAGNLNVQLHIIALDGAYERKSTGRLKFIPASAPTDESTMRLVTDIALRINGHLRKKRVILRRWMVFLFWAIPRRSFCLTETNCIYRPRRPALPTVSRLEFMLASPFGGCG